MVLSGQSSSSAQATDALLCANSIKLICGPLCLLFCEGQLADYTVLPFACPASIWEVKDSKVRIVRSAQLNQVDQCTAVLDGAQFCDMLH